MDGFLEQFVSSCEEHLGVTVNDRVLINEAEKLSARIQQRLEQMRRRGVTKLDNEDTPAPPAPETEVDPPVPQPTDQAGE